VVEAHLEQSGLPCLDTRTFGLPPVEQVGRGAPDRTHTNLIASDVRCDANARATAEAGELVGALVGCFDGSRVEDLAKAGRR
jgi:hypothetical protein